MAYQYLDDDAWMWHTSDGPHSSAAAIITRRNVVELHDERGQACGWSTIAGHPLRLCSPWPVAWPVGMVYIDPAESVDHIALSLRVTKVDWSVDDASPPPGSSEAIYLAGTVMGLAGQYRRPAESDWTMHYTTSTAQTIDIEISTRGLTGWLTIMLWTSSVTQLEEDADPAEYYSTDHWGGIEVSSLEEIATQPCERAISIGIPADSDKPPVYVRAGPLYMIGGWDDSSGYLLHTQPRFSPMTDESPAGPWGTQPQILYHTMGVLEVSGVSWRVVPGSIVLPGVSVYCTHRPISERAEEPLAAAIIRMTRRRVPMVSGFPGLAVDDPHVGLWRCRTNRSHGVIGESWVRLMTGIARRQMPGSAVGYEAVIGLLTLSSVTAAYQGDTTSTRFDLKITAETDASSWVEKITSDVTETTIQPTVGPYSTLTRQQWIHTMWGSDQYTSWQLRGALLDMAVEGMAAYGETADALQIRWYTLRLDEDIAVSGDYPLRISVWARNPDADFNASQDVFVVAGGIRVLPIGWS